MIFPLVSLVFLLWGKAPTTLRRARARARRRSVRACARGQRPRTYAHAHVLPYSGRSVKFSFCAKNMDLRQFNFSLLRARTCTTPLRTRALVVRKIFVLSSKRTNFRTDEKNPLYGIYTRMLWRRSVSAQPLLSTFWLCRNILCEGTCPVR